MSVCCWWLLISSYYFYLILLPFFAHQAHPLQKKSWRRQDLIPWPSNLRLSTWTIGPRCPTKLFLFYCKLFILKAARYKLCITIVLYLIKFMSNLFIFLIFQKFMFRPLAFYLNFFHFTCSKSDAPSTSMQSKCIVNDNQGQPLKSNLSTSSLIRPSYTIRATIFEKVFFWLEKFPKTECKVVTPYNLSLIYIWYGGY